MATIEIQFRHLIPPFDRGERFEDPLDELLRSKELGYVSGGGTDIRRFRSDISLEVNDVEAALPIIRYELRRLRAPLFTRVRVLSEPPTRVSVSVGQVVLVPIAARRFAVAKVLVLPEHLEDFGYVLIGLYCTYSSDGQPDDWPKLPAKTICTFTDPIRSGEWATISKGELTAEEKAAYPKASFRLEGITVFPKRAAEREALRILS